MKLTIILVGLVLATSAHAESCKPPNVARTVYPRLIQMACPAEGACRWDSFHGMETKLDVVCLNPKQNAEAESRWR